MTVFAETNVDVDLRMLRSFRVLRPLKLVSKIPSESVTEFCERTSASNDTDPKDELPPVELTSRAAKDTRLTPFSFSNSQSKPRLPANLCAVLNSYKHSLNVSPTPKSNPIPLL
ncbi:hypothetical protein PUN28_008677 [Cardiocondyla obscurior]|uniref:Uncharacterized protein n=1 Tax=Cardiocondyla obscurior TaxID=286306 RepID=A0AAW2G0F5_9HYME